MLIRKKYMITFINDSKDSKLGLNIYRKESNSIGIIVKWNTKNYQYAWFLRRPKIKGSQFFSFWTYKTYKSWRWIHPVSLLPLDGPNGKELLLNKEEK